MTRINVVDPPELMDQHLLAEYREIRLLCANLIRTLNSKAGFQQKKVPPEFTLNKGHVYFFFFLIRANTSTAGMKQFAKRCKNVGSVPNSIFLLKSGLNICIMTGPLTSATKKLFANV